MFKVLLLTSKVIPAVWRFPQKEISKFTQEIQKLHINREKYNTTNFLKFLNQTCIIPTNH